MTHRNLRLNALRIVLLTAVAAVSCRSPLVGTAPDVDPSEARGRLTIVLPSQAATGASGARSLSGRFGETVTGA